MQTTLNSISAVVHQAGYRWKNARVALTSTDPQYWQKVENVKATLARLAPDEAAFSIDEFGPVAVKIRGGRALQAPGKVRSVPQWQRSRGSFILTAALELTKNQVTYFFSERKNTDETLRLLELLRERYFRCRRLYLVWDAAPWHSSSKLIKRLEILNRAAARDQAPRLEILPLPATAQFLNVIESVFSGLARAVIHNSNYPNVDDAKAAGRSSPGGAEPRIGAESSSGRELDLGE